MKPCGGEGWRVWLLRPARVRTGYSLRTVLMTRECLGWFLAPTVVASHGRLGGARANSRANLRSSSRASSRINLQTNSRASSRIKPREASPEKKRTNFVSRIFRCTQRTRCPLLIWIPRKRRRSSALKDRSLAMRQELAGRGSVSWRGPDSGCSRQREFSVAFGEKARDRWAARPG